MLDFNTKKRILKRLSDCAEKHFIMLIPCLIAAGLVKLFYFIVCSIDIALSDKEGNFLGIKRESGEKAPKKKRKDDIVYVRRPFLSRAVSLVLAFAFVGMFVPVAMPAISASAAAMSADDFHIISDMYGTDANKYDYYFDSTAFDIYDPDERFNDPVVVDSACVSGYDSFKIVWERYDLRGASTEPTQSGSFHSFTVCYDVYDQSGNLESSGNVAKSYSYTSTTTSDLSKITSELVSGLNASKSYKFYIIVYQNVAAYRIPKGDSIADYVVTKTDSDGNVIKCEIDTSNTKVRSQTIQYPIRSNEVWAVLGRSMAAPVFEARYNSTGNTVDINVSAESAADSEVTGYLIYRSAENINGTSKTMGNFEYIGFKKKADLNGSTLVYSDSNISPTTKYSYVICTYSDIFGRGDEYNEKNGQYYITSPKPSGTSGNGLEETVYTPTQRPYPVSIADERTYFTLSWSSVPGATSYWIERVCTNHPDADGESIKVEVPADGRSVYTYEDKTVKFSTDDPHTYTYTVYAVNGDNKDSSGRSGNSRSEDVVISGQTLNTDVSRPYNFRGEGGDTSATLYWYCDDDQVTGFDIEMVKVTTDADGNEVLSPATYLDVKAATAKLSTDQNGRISYSYTEYDMTAGATYRFRIRSYMIIGDSKKKEPASEYIPDPPIEVKIVTDFRAPQEIEAVPDDGQITVNWTASPTATGYKLYILKKKGTKYENLGYKLVSGTSYVHSGLKNGETYQYYVIATKVVNGQTIESDPSDTVEATVGNPLKKPTDLTPRQVGDNVEITWKAVDGAEGYYLYIIGNGNTDIKDVTTYSYIQTDARYGVTYSYYVYAYKSIKLLNGTYQSYQSERSDIETLTIGGTIGFPSDLKATPSECQIDLTWTAVPDAAGYVVYATCEGRTETFNVTNPWFSHTGLTAGKTYSYYVVAYKVVNGVNVYSIPSATVSATAGGYLAAPTDFTVTTSESSSVLKWTAVKGAEGYTVYGVSADGQKLEIDVSKPTYTHTGLINGDTWTYYVKAYKTVNNQRVYSAPTTSITVKIGAALPAPPDLVAAPGNRQVDLKWTKVKDADGYIVYVYDDATATFQPISIVSKPSFSHTGLKNGQKYTYMVAAYSIIGGERVIGNYSLSVSAIPTAGNAADVDFTINVKGTVPYGISHSELISAAANHEAFDEPVDAYFSVNDESTRAIKEVLRGYANGLKSFIIYPFDISLYLENTLVAVEPNDGFNITFTIPVPDQMIGYRDYITVVHLKSDGTDTIYEDSYDDIFISSAELEVLPSAIIDVNGVWCVQFTTDSCSPFAFVIYKDNLDDVSSGGASAAGGASEGGFNTGVLLFTALPDIMPSEKKTKFVVATKKRYHIKK